MLSNRSNSFHYWFHKSPRVSLRGWPICFSSPREKHKGPIFLNFQSVVDQSFSKYNRMIRNTKQKSSYIQHMTPLIFISYTRCILFSQIGMWFSKHLLSSLGSHHHRPTLAHGPHSEQCCSWLNTAFKASLNAHCRASSTCWKMLGAGREQGRAPV